MEKDIVLIGKIGTAHGLKGWVKIHSATKPKEQIVKYQPWLIDINGTWQEIRFIEHYINSNDILVHLPNCDDRNTATSYTNKNIALYREQLPALDNEQYYWADLEGLSVINQDGVILGTVSYLFEAGANDVMVVTGKKQHLIPYVKGIFALEVDLKKQTILVNWDNDF